MQHLYSWYRMQHRARLIANALRMGQVASVVIGDAQRQRMTWRNWCQFRQQFGHVADHGGKRLGAFRMTGSSRSR